MKSFIKQILPQNTIIIVQLSNKIYDRIQLRKLNHIWRSILTSIKFAVPYKR